jgi:hypothetical protein
MRIIAAVVGASLLWGSANAQAPEPPQDLTGNWFIQIFGDAAPDAPSSPITTKDKVADGAIAFAMVGEGDYDCSFNISFNFDPAKNYGSGGGWAVETCQATLRDGKLTVRSTVVRASSPQYRPDNFELKLQSAERMSGTLVGETDGRGGPFVVILKRR